MNTYTYKDLTKVTALLKGEHGELWLFDTTPENYRYKCYSEDTSLMRQINSWEGAIQGATYHRKDGVMITYDVIIPKRLVRRACKVLGISFKKDEQRSAHAKQLGAKFAGNLINGKKEGSDEN